MTDQQIAEAIIHQLHKRHDIRATPVEVDALRDSGDRLKGVNLWHSPYDRYPSDTVWVGAGTVTWGGSFQHELPADTPPAELADQIAETLEPR